ncbi:MAG: squalene synthase HpnC [Alphaproteobacteria bacterium]
MPTQETPQRTRDAENFPVGSWLLPARLRVHIVTYYDFARAADDIADDPSRTAEAKVAELEALETVLLGETEANMADPKHHFASRLRDSMTATGVPFDHATELLRAFRQDATKQRYRDWAEVMDYCRYSAAPVGRFLLSLHGEDEATWPASDALCASLQMLNHVQDCGVDRRRLDRVYLPLDWLDDCGAEIEDLDRDRATPAMRAVIDHCLDACDDLNAVAKGLPRLIADRRMRMEAAVIVEVAHRLSARLRRGDPLAERVELSALAKLGCVVSGIGRGFW